MTKSVEKDSTVSLHFNLTLADGSPVDGTSDGEPMIFKMGDGAMIEVFENVILGLSVGEKQQVSMDPREAIGFPDDENKHWMDRAEFKMDVELQKGLIIEFSTPEGENIPGALLEITEDKVLVDFNHPLAGHEIIFSVEIVDIK